MFWLILFVTFITAILLTALLRGYALRSGLIDHPNARSSHSIPTPRGGGLAIALTSLLAATLLCGLHLLPVRTYAAFAGGGLAVATVGFLDDRRPLPARLRFAVHVAAALWCLGWLGGLPLLLLGSRSVDLGWAGYLLGVPAIVWVLNLFNFMDGIDGIAGAEAVFVVGAGAVFAALLLPDSGTAHLAGVTCAACAGFLLWNWPPAKIFMGDVGSGYLGYAIAALALAAGHEAPVSLWIWLILGGGFFVDATVTLIRRSLRGDKVYQAHRSHAYQWLARRWQAHCPVTLALVAINLGWLLPCAWLAFRQPDWAPWVVLGALLPLVIAVLLAGAGRREEPQG